DGLVSNWAYMVIAALAWNMKAWYGPVTVVPAVRQEILKMEFKRFLLSFMQIPCQIVAKGRRLVYRVLTCSRHLEAFFDTFDHIRKLKFV
ncbi:MAG TPA: IS1380 family transposase, partial [Acidobacteriota bacterium]|nr:IS1380 family transposase [Acidobacteriota bacterium]